MVRQAEIEEKAREFAAEWNGKGDEKQHSQKFWIGLLRNVCGCVAPEKVIDFEERVKIGATKYIDGYIRRQRTVFSDGTVIEADLDTLDYTVREAIQRQSAIRKKGEVDCGEQFPRIPYTRYEQGKA